jgi:Ca2+-binding RTX toxin-like protein
MANFSTNVQVDFSQETRFFSVAPSSVRAASSSKIELVDPDGNIQVYSGSFTYNYSYGYKYLNWSGSSLNGYAVYDNPATILGKATGLAVSGTVYKLFADANDGSGLIQYVFRNNDVMQGSSFGDVIWGYGGNDRILGMGGNDTLAGGIGNDTLDGGSGADYLQGDAGNDTYLIDSYGDVVVELVGEGTDTVIISDPNIYEYFLDSNIENAILKYADNRFLYGNDLSNILTGSAGDNFFEGGLGDDSIDGGAGFDKALYTNAASAVSVDLTTGLVSGGAGNDRLKNIEAVSGSSFDDTLIGNAARNQLIGNAGNDTLFGRAGADELIGLQGNDTLDGGLGNDILQGGSGDDVYVVDSARDLVSETRQLDNNIDAGGVDTVLASASFTLSDYVENLYLTGNARINGVGNSLDNLIVGNAGANIIDGGLGADTLVGGLGNDTYVADSVNDVIIELANGGVDTLQIGFSAAEQFTLSAHVENAVLKSGFNVAILGNSLNNNILGNALDNTISGGEGSDVLDGGAGSDWLVYNYTESAISVNLSTGRASDGRDDIDRLKNFENVLGTVQSDTITGDAKNNILNGGNGDGYDWLYGLGGNDLLIGGGGNDQLFGGLGRDTLEGGAGGDLFVFDTALGAQNIDLILDFTVGVDKIGLDFDVFKKLRGTNFNDSNFVTVSEGSGGTTADHMFVYNTTNDILYYDADGFGGKASVAIAEVRIIGPETLSFLDFHLMP